MESYIEYVEKRIEELKEITELIKEGQVVPARLNWALASYANVSLMLQSEYQRLKMLNSDIEQEYNMWWDKKFLIARDSLNDGRTSSKFASKTEIEAQAKVDNEKEYMEWQSKISQADSRVRFILKLIDIWNKQDSLLVTLSNNMRSEMRALYVGQDGWGQENQTPESRPSRRIAE